MSNNFKYHFPLTDNCVKENNFVRALEDYIKESIGSKEVEVSLVDQLSCGGCSTYQNFNVLNRKNAQLSFTIYNLGSYKKLLENNNLAYKLIYTVKDDEDEEENILVETGFLEKSEKKLYVEVEVIAKDCQESQIAKPLFVNYLIKKRMIAKVAGFRLSNHPVKLRLDDAENLAKIVCDSKENGQLPILYIRNNDQKFIDKITHNYSGIALMLMDDDPDLIEDFPQYVDEKLIPKENTISLFHTKNVKTFDCDNEHDIELLSKNISDYLRNSYSNDGFNFEYAITEKLLNIMKDTNQDLGNLRNEIQALKKENAELKLKTNKGLNIETKGIISLSKKTTTTHQLTGPLLYYGKEEDLYDGEIKDMIISSLRDYRKKYVMDNSRRADILDDILNSNKSSDICKKKAEEIEHILNGYDGPSPKTIRELENVGFSVKSGNHLKCTWYKDPRYQIVTSCTPSERKTGKNVVTSIINTCL